MERQRDLALIARQIAPQGPADHERAPLKRTVLWTLSVVLLWRSLLLIVGVLAPHVLAPAHKGAAPPFGWQPTGLSAILGAGAHGDAIWYVSVAQHGYQYSETHMSSMGFYPLYPLAIRVFMLVIPEAYLAAEILSTLCLVVVAVLLSLWMRDRGQQQRTPVAMAALLLYPFSLFYGVAYTESMFLLLVLASWLAYARQRWWLASAAVLLLVLTRPTGIVVLPLLLVLRQSRRMSGVPSLLPVASGIAGILGFCGYQWLAFGTPVAYQHAKAVPGWNVSVHQIVSEFLLRPDSGYPSAYLILMLAAGGLAVMLLPLTISRLGWVSGTYVVLSLGLALTAGLPGLTRYVSVCFPVFCALAAGKHPVRLVTVAPAAAILSVGTMALYAAGYGIY